MCRSRRRAGALATVALATAVAAPPARGVSMKVVRIAGETSPLGWAYSGFGEGTVDASGGLVFIGSSTAIFQRPGSTIVQRLGSGSTLADGRHVSGVGPPALTPEGCVLGRATLAEGGEAVLRACGDTITIVLEAGTAAPGGGTIRAFDPAVFASGPNAVSASATLADGTAVVLRRDAGGLVEIARSGVATPTGGTYATFRLLGGTAGGVTGFRATVTDGPDGLFSATGAGVETIAVGGQASPAGGSFETIGGGTLNESGTWAFRATLSGNRPSVFAADTSGPTPVLRPVAIAGDAVPIEGGTIGSFPSSIDPSINAGGTVVFRALLDGIDGTPSGVFAAAPDGTLTAIATVRQSVDGIGTLTRLRDPVIADDGSVVVSATISGVGPSLLVWRDGRLESLAELGDATDADAGTARFRFSSASVVDTAEGAAFLGQRDAVFRSAAPGATDVLAYVGGDTPLGGAIASLGPPCVDGRGAVYFGAELQHALFNEALLTATEAGLQTVASPDLRLLGGGGIRELFPSSVDQLARPAAADRGVVFTAALKGAKASAAIFRVRKRRRFQPVARVGQSAGGQRLANLGTPATGPGNRLAFLADFGRNAPLRRGLVATSGTKLGVVAIEGISTRTRIESSFDTLGPPAIGRAGTAFHATTTQEFLEGIFIGRGPRVGVVAASGATTQTGGRLRTFGDPIVVDDDVWFLARIAGSVAPQGLYRVRVPAIPGRDDPPLPVEPILQPGDPAPVAIGGVIVRLDALRVGPSGVVSVVAEIGGGSAPSAILALDPTLP